MTVVRESFWVDGLYRDEDGYFRYGGGKMDAETFATACMQVGRNDGPALLFDLHDGGALVVHLHPEVVADVWSMAEWPANNVPAGLWVDLFKKAGFTRDGNRPHGRSGQ